MHDERQINFRRDIDAGYRDYNDCICSDYNLLVSYLNEVVIYNKDNSYTEYAGQAVIFTLSLADGSQVEIIAYNPFIIIDGIGYKCKYEPCEALNHYANELMTREP